jgi:GNAT superfamily N-acetyltransferase
MIIRTAANEQEIQRAVEVYFANEPTLTSADKEGVIAHWLVLYTDCPEGFWLAEIEATREIVGVASATRRPPQWLLANFYVLPTYHGQGIGRLLLSKSFATYKDCERFAVHASLHHSAQSLYMQFGMYPLPYSIHFKGSPQNHLVSPTVLTAEDRPINDLFQSLDALDREALGFTRAMDHKRWAKHGSYFLAKAEDQIIAYFRVSPERRIGPLVVSNVRWMPAALDLAIYKQWELFPGDQEIFIPGTNTTALAYLLAHDFHFQELHLLLSSHPMPGLAQVVFHDMDFF